MSRSILQFFKLGTSFLGVLVLFLSFVTPPPVWADEDIQLFVESSGGNAILYWDATRVFKHPFCKARGALDWNGFLIRGKGSRDIAPSEKTTYILECHEADQTAQRKMRTQLVTVDAASRKSLVTLYVKNVPDNTLYVDKSASLAWFVTPLTQESIRRCVLSSADDKEWAKEREVSSGGGSVLINPAQTARYTMKCFYTNGKEKNLRTALATVKVIVEAFPLIEKPVITLSMNTALKETIIKQGEKVVLNWNVSGQTDGCTRYALKRNVVMESGKLAERWSYDFKNVWNAEESALEGSMIVIPTTFTQYRIACWKYGIPGTPQNSFTSEEEVVSVALEDVEEKIIGPVQALVMPRVPTVSPAKPATPSVSATLAQAAQKLLTAVSDAKITAIPLFSRHLSQGARGKDVEALQLILLASGYYKGKVTGILNVDTVSSVKKLQEAAKIASSKTPGYGTVGPATRKFLNALVADAKTKVEEEQKQMIQKSKI